MTRISSRTTSDTFVHLLNLFEPQTIRFNRRVFVNRNLRMSSIGAVGFDMDYTLAIYTPELDHLAWKLVLDRLVRDFGFSSSVRDFEYDPTYAIRGLVIDLPQGNLFKMDSHRHVARAYHGTRPLDPDDRKSRYRRRFIQVSRRDHFLVDTLFSLPEAHLYSLYVDMMDSRPGRRTRKEYATAYRAIRKAMDTIHQDGSLKKLVLQDLDRYLVRDPDLPATLEQLRASGKDLFLLTNSHWPYTNAVMSYLLDGALDGLSSWMDYFRLIVTAAHKPSFFGRNGPLDPVQGAGRQDVYSGGNLKALESLLGVGGDGILYIGDHIYGDILKSKRTSNWRTAMIVPEMETELAALEEVREYQLRADRMFRERTRLEVELNYQQRLLMMLMDLCQPREGNHLEEDLAEARLAGEANVTSIRRELAHVEDELKRTRTSMEASFNPRWGMLFSEGNEHSVFGDQVEDYACVYTGKVSNFLSYSPMQYFRSPRDVLPHQIEL